MSTNSIIKYWKIPEVIIVTIILLIGYLTEPSGYFLLTIYLIPIIIYKILSYSYLYRQTKSNDFEIFGITRSRYLFNLISAILIGGCIIFLVAYFNESKPQISEDLAHWIWIGLICSHIIDSFIPYSNWTVIILGDKLYKRRTFYVQMITLKSTMTIRKITNEKIELELEEWSDELPIKSNEILKLQMRISKLNATNND